MKAPKLSPLVTIPAGSFVMGSNDHYPEEAPTVEVSVDEFEIEKHPVTNEQFAQFVKETGYRTVAERPIDPADFPDAPAENLHPGSLVFTPTTGPVDLRHMSLWWTWTPGAFWRRPEGPGSSIKRRPDHPVVQVAYEDAAAYAEWCDRRLPTEAEWERAARGSLVGEPYAWGAQAQPDGKRLAKWFQGDFPYRNAPDDGFERTSPVGTYPPSEFGLLDITGNVWEWTDDWYADSPVAPQGCCGLDRNDEIAAAASINQRTPQFATPRKVLKGGSFLCADEYCQRYRPAARRGQMIDTGMSHVGFRCAR